MKSFTYTIIAACAAMTVAGSALAADTLAAQNLENHIRSLNKTVLNNHAEKEALHGINVETGVPLERLQEIHKNNPKTGPAGIMVACVLADESKKEPELFVKRSAAGTPWRDLATANNVPFEKIEARLAKLETYIQSGGDQKPVQRPAAK